MKRAVVTGGTRGIGLACARKLSELGYEVTATFSSDGESAGRAKEILPAVRFVRADVSDEGAVRALFEEVGRLDVLVCNAGVSHFGQVQDVTEEAFDRVFSVNAKGVFLCCKHAVPRMLGEGGAIVAVSSVWGETGGSCESVYSASKGAVLAFCKALAKELAPSNITVNTVSPGVVETGMNARLSEEERRALEEEIPLGRFASPDEVAEAILFLAESRYITGWDLAVNGGFHI